MSYHHVCRLALMATASSLVLSAPARAEQGQPGSSAPADEIIVTARRIEERLSDVPLSVSAINGEGLTQRQISTEADLQRSVPGLTIRQNGSANQFNYALRGQSVDSYSNSPPGVLPYINEAQVQIPSSTTFYDLGSIQVLKGPQGTLFGRNATGGAVLFETAKPKDHFEGNVTARYESRNLAHVDGAVSIPFGDLGGLRIAGLYNHGGAFVRNVLDGQKFGKQDTRSIRGTLVLTPTPGLRNTTVLQHTAEGGNNVPTLLYAAYACGSTYKGVPLFAATDCAYGTSNPAYAAYLAAHPALPGGGAVALAAQQRAWGPWKSMLNFPLDHKAKSTFVTNTTEYDVSPSLKLKNIAMYNNSWSKDGFDYDGTPYPIFENGGTPNANGIGVSGYKPSYLLSKQFSEELQAQGSAFDNQVKYVVGGYYLHEEIKKDYPLYGVFAPGTAGFPFSYAMKSTVRSRALFGQATVAVTDQFNITGGLRWTWDTVTARQFNPDPVDYPNYYFPGPVERMKANKPSWNISIDYHLNPDLMVYVTQRGSWRGGGYNHSVAPKDAPAAQFGNRFEAEMTKDVELGLKYSGRGLGMPVVLNVDFYNQWVSNGQRAAYVPGLAGPGLVTANVPRAQITGVEGELTIRPTPWASLGVSGAYTNARYTRNTVLVQGQTTLYGPYADAPKWTGTVYGQLDHQLSGDMGTITLRVDMYMQSKFYFSNVAATQAPGARISGYSLINGRASWNDIAGSNISAALFVRNLLDKEYYTGGNSLGPTLGIETSVPGRPRTIGGELQVKF
ncbi:MAG TPA: TonB-dependent receptor [Sphingobium sp.]|nr:TonB-dependent receptor [Sphingobium sp.]